MAKKPMRNKTQEPAPDCDNSLSKLPEATVDQLNLAKLLAKPDDIDLSSFVAKLRELTECTEDQAVTALYDSENNLERAIELLLDKFRLNGEEWHTSKRKQKTKPSPDVHKQEHGTTNIDGDKRIKQESQQQSVRTKNERNDHLPFESGDRRKNLGRHNGKNVGSDDGANADSEKSESVYQSDVRDHKLKVDRMRDTDGWDPYTEYGGWGGESIEVVNSNASIARISNQKDDLSDELFVESDGNKSLSGQTTEDGQSSEKPSPSTNADSDSIFVSKALSKQPPHAFTNLHSDEVFIAPELPDISLNLKFGGELFNEYIPENLKARINVPIQRDCNISSLPVESTVYAMSPSKSPNYPPLKIGTTKSLLDNSTQADFKTENVGNYSSEMLLDAKMPPKATNSFSTSHKSPRPASFGNDNISGQSSYLDPSLKNYIMDNLPDNINKISVNETPLQSSKASQFNFPQAAQTQSVASTLPQTQSVNTSLQHQIAKAAHIASAPQQNHPSSVATGSSQTQAASLPPGMPHFIGQFTPPPYMFNLPGASSNAAAFLDMDQLQLFQQQQRMLYGLQQQVATTAQSLLTSNTDTPATSKSVSQNMPGSLSHIAASSSNIRPELLASAMGHAPQMLPPGNPYFSYPGFVLMNGYTNPFLNQHQHSNADGPNLNTTLGTSSMNQPSTISQSYGGMKPGYDDLFDMKYPDPAKQVGFKNNTTNPSNFNFQVPSTGGDGGSKVVSNQSSGSVLNQSGFTSSNATGANNGGGPQPPQQQPPYGPQIYASTAAAAPYLTAAVVAAAAAAATAQQQQEQQAAASVTTNAPNANGPPSGAGGGGNNQMVAQLQMGLHPHHPHHPAATHQHQRSVMHHHHHAH